MQTASGVGPKVAQAITRRAGARRPAPGHRGRRRQDADPGPRDRAEGSPSGSSSSSRTGSARRSASRAARRRSPVGGLARPGAPGPRRPRLAVARRRARRRRGRGPGRRRSPTSPRCCAPPSSPSRRPEPMHEDELTEAETAHLVARGVSLTTAEAEGDERAVEAALRPRDPRRGDRPDPGPCAARAGPRGRPAPRAAARPRAALRASRPRQDDPGHDHRRRDGRAAAAHQRTGHHARRRPGRDPVRAQRRRRAVRRRAAPDVPAGRGDALPRDGGLPGRRRHRQGARRHGDPAGHPAVHARRRHDPRRPAARARCATGSGSPGTWSSTRPTSST